MPSSIPDPPLAPDERRDLVRDELRAMRVAPAWRLCQRTGLGPAAVGAALRGLCARGLAVKVRKSKWDRVITWWEAT